MNCIHSFTLTLTAVLGQQVAKLTESEKECALSGDVNRCRLGPSVTYPDSYLFEPEISSLRHSVEDYYAKFQVTAIMGFRFIVLTYPPTHIHHDKGIAIYCTELY